jgi:hypothetical protein
MEYHAMPGSAEATSFISCMVHGVIALLFAASTLVFAFRRAHAYCLNKSAPSVAITLLVMGAGIVCCVRAGMSASYDAQPGPYHWSLYDTTHQSRFFATAVAFGLTNTLGAAVAMSCGVEPGHQKLAWVTVVASLAGIPASSLWIVSRAMPAVYAAFMSRGICFWASNYVLSAASGHSWFSVTPVVFGFVYLLGWLELHRYRSGEGTIAYFFPPSPPDFATLDSPLYHWTHVCISIGLFLAFFVAYCVASTRFVSTKAAIRSLELLPNMPRFSGVISLGRSSVRDPISGATLTVLLALVVHSCLRTLRSQRKEPIENEPILLEAESRLGVVGRVGPGPNTTVGLSDVPDVGFPRGLLALHQSGPLLSDDSLFNPYLIVMAIGMLGCASVAFASMKGSIQKRRRPEPVKSEAVTKQGAFIQGTLYKHRWQDEAAGGDSVEGILNSIEQASAATAFHDAADAVAPHLSLQLLPEMFHSTRSVPAMCGCVRLLGRSWVNIGVEVVMRPYPGTTFARCTSVSTGMLQKILKLLQGAKGIPGVSEIAALIRCPCGNDVSMKSEMPANSLSPQSRWRYSKLTSTLNSWVTELVELSRTMQYTISLTFDGKTECFSASRDSAPPTGGFQLATSNEQPVPGSLRSSIAAFNRPPTDLADAPFQFLSTTYDDSSTCTSIPSSPCSERSAALSSAHTDVDATLGIATTAKSIDTSLSVASTASNSSRRSPSPDAMQLTHKDDTPSPGTSHHQVAMALDHESRNNPMFPARLARTGLPTVQEPCTSADAVWPRSMHRDTALWENVFFSVDGSDHRQLVDSQAFLFPLHIHTRLRSCMQADVRLPVRR